MITASQIATYFGVLPPRIRPGQENVKIICPECSSTRKKSREACLSIYVASGDKKGTFNCKHCGYKGKITEEKREAEPRPQETKLDIDTSVLKYLTEERKLSKDSLIRLKVGSSVQWFGENKRCVNLNYFWKGRHYNTKLRTRDKDMRFEVAGKDMILYNADIIPQAKEMGWLIITEGEFDALAWDSCGFHYVVSVPNGASENVSFIDKHMEDILEIETMYINTDDDEKGKVLEDALVKRIGEERCRLVRLPKKDANEVVMDAGSLSEAGEVLAEAFESAELPPKEGVYKLPDVREEAKRFMINGFPETYPLYVDGLDHEKDYDSYNRVVINRMGWLELPLGHLMAVSGTPNSGKSALVDWISAVVMDKHQWRVGKILTEEDTYLNISKQMGKLAQLAYNKIDPDKEFDMYYNYLENMLYYGEPENLTLDSALDKFLYMIRAYGIKLCVLDNFSSLDFSDEKGYSTTEKIGSALSKLQRFTRKHNVLLILVVHPVKLEEDMNGGYKLPNGYDLMGSSHWFNFVDIGLSVGWRDVGITNVKIWKIRYLEFVGKKGVFDLAYDIDKGGIYEPLRSQRPRTVPVDLDEDDWVTDMDEDVEYLTQKLNQ